MTPTPPRRPGCQLRPWLQTLGPAALRAQLPAVMAELGAIGFAGFETALAALPIDDPAGFAEARARAGGLALAAAHAGGEWWSARGQGQIGPLAEQAARLPALGCALLVVSMSPPPAPTTDAQRSWLAANLGALGRACRAAGVRVALHNHWWELADDALLLRTVVAGCDPQDVALAPDLGWAAAGGGDPAGLIARFGPRIAHLHLRDRVAGPDGGFIELGRGAIDYRAIMAALDGQGYAGWLIAESEFADQWRGLGDPAATARAQWQGLSALI